MVNTIETTTFETDTVVDESSAPRCIHAAEWAFDLQRRRVVRRPCAICAAIGREAGTVVPQPFLRTG